MAELIALLHGAEVGRVRSDARGRLSFVYENAWRNAEVAYPLSLSMPLAAEEHGLATVQAFLWGLLPDNEQVLERWAKKFQVSARNVFALISNVGEDCAGAIQFVTPDRFEALKTGKDDKIEWLDRQAPSPKLRLSSKATNGALRPGAYQPPTF
ncbi:HipA N-terminal domain-containing protein [Bradyrhizobium yuanmingense]|uniref:HipA N-terminal domain-containing protein n=1 Tax=Bradyrhizobium yuanmingense TaxID=108015 RepID=UPI0021A4DAB6|nr:HipA N-terminal domain-containing protein [Bradyrhizobium sp. CB1024]UWU83279.1 HipA N-terminal domain-containing protein [Bradyrhizobium sp. CB1024]